MQEKLVENLSPCQTACSKLIPEQSPGLSWAERVGDSISTHTIIAYKRPHYHLFWECSAANTRGKESAPR